MSVRVCMLIYNYWPGLEGGTEHQCRKLVNELAERDVVCTILTARTARGMSWRDRDGGTSVFRLPTLSGFLNFQKRPKEEIGKSDGAVPPSWRSRIQSDFMCWINTLFFQLSAILHMLFHAREYDLFHVHTAEWIAGLAVWLGKLFKKPVLCKAATMPVLPESRHGLPFKTTCLRLRRSADFLALNERMKSDLVGEGIDPDRITVVPNSVQLPELSQRTPEAGLYLFVGNLTQTREKAFDVLFKAWVQVAEKLPHARLVVVGRGEPAAWEEYLDDAGFRESVLFEGYVSDVDSFYKRAEIFILPSRQEGMSNALLEAQSWGIPCVVSDIPGNLAVVEDGVNGLVVPVEEDAALAEALVKLAEDEKMRSRLALAGRNGIEQQFTVNAIAKLTYGVYEKLLSRGG